MSGIELKPCPFCGGRAKIEVLAGYQLWWSVTCTDCCASHKRTAGGGDVTDPIRVRVAELWNRRASLPESGEAVAWRWKHPKETAWKLSPNHPGWTPDSPYIVDALCLCASPVPDQGEVDRLRFALECVVVNANIGSPDELADIARAALEGRTDA